ncbi:hypothetical protein [Papillibacter cinnamivorans]|uniref:Uncharacterized protein n=1 Tax=Papillibacter cinnamivorans DSM 12816 TaxID=1122930 RepID=A0A1W1YXX1_9FIRM|nr:hypothetical protein [Papillibacter cinnamivorans]SMC40984.1 hypothetical protein SAMN02745168_0762 [Papillibacter cinnamivorans DSM 12816]
MAKKPSLNEIHTPVKPTLDDIHSASSPVISSAPQGYQQLNISNSVVSTGDEHTKYSNALHSFRTSEQFDRENAQLDALKKQSAAAAQSEDFYIQAGRQDLADAEKAKSVSIGKQIADVVYKRDQTGADAYYQEQDSTRKSMEQVQNDNSFLKYASKGKQSEDNKVEYAATHGGSDDPTKYDPNVIGAVSEDIKYQYMTDAERNVYAYYIGKGETDKANQYLGTIDRELNARKAQSVYGRELEKSSKNKAYAVVNNLLNSKLSVGGTLYAGAQALSNAVTGKYVPIDPNSPAMLPAIKEQATRAGITKDMTPTQAFLANVGISIGQSASSLPFGVAGLASMAGAASGAQALQSAQSGGSAAQVFSDSAVTGAVEYLTEKLPFENLLKLAKTPTKLISKAGVVQILKQAGIEASEEVVSQYTETLADMAIMGDKSQYAQYVQDLVDSGVSKSEASKRANTEFFATQPVLSALGGALSGGIMGAGATAIGNITQGPTIAQDSRTDVPNAVQAEPAKTAQETIKEVTPTVKTNNVSERQSDVGTIGDTQKWIQSVMYEGKSPYSVLKENIKTGDGNFAGYLFSTNRHSFGPYYELTIRTKDGRIKEISGNSNVKTPKDAVIDFISNDLRNFTSTGTKSQPSNIVDSLQAGDTLTLPSGVSGTVSKKTKTSIYFEFDNGGKAEAKLDGSVGSVILNRINNGEIKINSNKNGSASPVTPAESEVGGNARSSSVSETILSQNPPNVDENQTGVRENTYGDDYGGTSVGAAESRYAIRDRAIAEIQQAAKDGIVDKFDINNLISAEREVAKYEKELALWEQKIDTAEKLSQQKAKFQDKLADQKAEFKDATERSKYVEMYRRLLDQADAAHEKAIAVAKENAKGNVRLERAIDHYKEIIEHQRIRRSESAQRSKLLSLVHGLNKMKLSPDVKSQVRSLIGDIDTTAKGMTEKTELNLRNLKAEYESAKQNDPDFIPNKKTEEMIARLDRKKIADMDINDVQELTEVLRGVKYEIKTAKKEVGVERAREIKKVAEGSISEIESAKGSKSSGPSMLINGYNSQSLSPGRMFKRLAGWKDGSFYSIYKQLENGQTKMLDFQMKATKSFDDFTSRNKKLFESWTGSKAQFIDTGIVAPNGTAVKITPAMRISLYLHSLNADNLRHINSGGITIPNPKLYLAGNLSDAYAKGTIIKLSPSQIKSITNSMTEQEGQFADLAYNYFNTISKNAINETSLELLGYELATVDDYFPINSNKNFTRSEFESLIHDGTIEGMGLLKSRVASSNPIVLEDVTSVLLRQIDNVSKYNGLAAPVRNFNKVYNATMPEYANSVKNALSQKWGKSASEYIEKMIADIQRPNGKVDGLSRTLMKLRGNFAQATLALNPSVTMKQVASLPTAAANLGWIPVSKSIVSGKVDYDLIDRYTPLLWYRRQGNSTTELGDVSQKQGLTKKLPALMNWVQSADVFTVGRIWKASEAYVDQNTELKAGTDEFYKSVAEVFNRTIYDTQPNYTLLQRPQVLRSDDQLVRSLTMFMTQRLQNYNMLVESVESMRSAKTEYKSNPTASNKQAAKTASQQFVRTISALAAGAAMISIINNAWRKVRGKEEEKFEKEMLSTISGSFLGGGELYSLLNSAITGDKWYDVEAPNISTINDLVNGILALSTSLNRVVGGVSDITGNGGSVLDYIKANPTILTSPLQELSVTIGTMFGVPVANVERYIIDIIGSVSPEFKASYSNIFILAGNSALGKSTGKDILSTFNIVLDNAVSLDDSVKQELYRLYQLGDSHDYSVLPKQPPISFEHGSETIKLSPSETMKFNEVYDEYVTRVLTAKLKSSSYKSESTEDKIKDIKTIYRDAYNQAKAKILEMRGID